VSGAITTLKVIFEISVSHNSGAEDSSLPEYNAVTLDKEFLDSLTSKFEVITIFRNVCSPCDLCGEQSGTGRGLSLPISVSPFSVIPSMLHIHS